MAAFTVLDGGLSTALAARGVDLDHELWTAGVLLGDPDVLIDAHADFVRAGADVLITASYQAGIEQLTRAAGTRADALRLIAATTARARAAFERAGRPGGQVAASLGPYGALLADGSEYSGSYEASWHQVRATQAARLAVLAETGPDWLAVETVPTRVEADMVLEELLDHPHLRAWVAFTCRDAERTWGGDPIEKAIELASSSPQVAAVGVNCTAPHHVDELLERARSVTDTPLVVYPNHGRTWDAAHNEWSGDGPERMDWEAWVPRWMAHGAVLIGGCCGVGPAEIARLAGLRDELEQDLDGSAERPA